MNNADETDALLVRDAAGKKARVLLCTVYGMECNRHFGDLLLTCSLNEGGPEEVVHLMLNRCTVDILTSFLKRYGKAIAQSESLDRLPVVVPWSEPPAMPVWEGPTDSKKREI
jgi:hypothetical protein